MKCPHCFCNYDDAERECPMCGKRAWPGAKRADHRRSAARPAAVRPAQARQAVRRTDSEEIYHKRRRRLIRWLIAGFILLQLAPMLAGLAQSTFFRVRRSMEYRDDGFHVSPPEQYTPETTGPSAAPEREPDGAIPSGEYYCEDTGLFLSIDNDSQTYWLSLSDHEETGDFYALYNEPGKAESSDYYTAEFPDTDYDSYVLYLYHEEYEITLVVAYLPLEGGGECFYLNNTYADAFWLPLDRAVRLEK